MNEVPPNESLPNEISNSGFSGQEPPDAENGSRRWVRILGLLLITIAAIAGWYLMVGYLAWQNGQTLREENQTTAFYEQMAAQVTLARQDMDQQKYRLAQRRLEWVLERDPNQAEAAQLLAEVLARLNIFLTPQPTGVPPTATPRPLPTPTPGLISDPADELARIRQLLANEEWEEAATALLTFQMQYPSYEREETDQMLYDAYVTHGLELISGDHPELGLAMLERAEQLGDLPQEALDYRLWARLYMSGIAYYGVNWEIAALNFRELCLSAPFYQGACDRLIESLVNLGNQYAYLEEWCPAQSYFREARQYGAAVNDQLSQAEAGCAAATPTPSGVITDTVPFTDTLPLEETPPSEGTDGG
jgi:hypothetical protein